MEASELAVPLDVPRLRLYRIFGKFIQESLAELEWGLKCPNPQRR